MVLFAMFMSLNAQNLTKSNPANDFWTIIEPPLPNSAVSSLIEDKQGNIVVALGDNRKGVFLSRDEGITWDSLGLSGVYIYRLYQNFDGRLFATSGAYHGLYVLEEGSTGWIGIPNPGKDNITAILGTEDTTLFIGGWEGIYKNKDWNNYSWEYVFQLEGGTTQVKDFIDVGNGILLASVTDYLMWDLGGILRSIDNGDTWEFVELEDNFMESFAKNSHNVIFASSYDWDHSLYKSEDFGATWELLPNCFECIPSIVVDSNDILYTVRHCDLGIPQGVFRSSDDGKSFDPLEDMTSIPIHNLYLSPDGYLYAYYRSRESVYSEFSVELVAEPADAGFVNGSGYYLFGDRAQLNASPSNGYQFVCWINQDGDTISCDPDYRHFVTRNYLITALFDEVSDMPEFSSNSTLIWPNPVSDVLSIDGLHDNDIITIYDVTGCMVYRQSYHGNTGINMSTLNSGIYFMSVESVSGKSVFRDKHEHSQFRNLLHEC